MTALRALVAVNLRRSLRDPVSVLFSLAFGPVLVVMLGLIFGNDPTPEFGGLGYLDTNLMAFPAITIAIVSFIMLPVDLVGQRDQGVLRRFMATPLPPLTFILADLVVRLVLVVVSVLAMFAIGILLGAQAPGAGNLLLVMVAVVLGVTVFLVVGYALCALLPSVGAVQGVGNVLVYLMIFLSGATAPLAVLPSGVQRVAELSPLTQLVVLMRRLWEGTDLAGVWVPVVTLLGVLVVALVVAAKRFRWE